jgi:putative sterol carrier protein
VATDAPTLTSPAAAALSYADLYARWESGQWSATGIDLTVDAQHWREELDSTQRRAVLWNYCLFFHGEHVVAATLSPFIDAAPLDEQKYFLATQQADEARHAVFFTRFMTEIVGMGDNGIAARQATDAQLTWGFRKVFGRLEALSRELQEDPSPQRLAAGVMLYHVIIEAALAQPGQHLFEEHLENTGLLPGLLEGMRNISRDEQRHIGFGVKLLADLVQDPDCREAAIEMLRQVMPWSTGLYIPPGWDESLVNSMGFTMEDTFEKSIESLDSKLRAVGLPHEELHGAWPQDPALPPVERAKHVGAMLRANLIGDGTLPASHDPEAVAYLFEAIENSVDHRHAPARPVTLAWDFTDHEPWHLVVDDGRTAAAPGMPSNVDLTLRCRFQDWVDVATRRRDPRRAMIAGRLRPRGDVRLLRQLPKMFPG